MSGSLIELKEAALMLGMSPEQLNEMRSRSEIFGYRDGNTWKFKQQEIERFADEQGITLGAGGGASSDTADGDDGFDDLLDMADLEPVADGDDTADADDESILVSEEELGHSHETTSSTIIGRNAGEDAGASDLKLSAEDDLVLEKGPTAGAETSDVQLASDSDLSPIEGSAVGDDWDLDLTIDMDADAALADDDELKLEDDPVAGASGLSLEELGDEDIDGGSALDLTADDDDDMVLGSGVGSDITLGVSDSGIGLASPADSGLSLEEEPLELGGSQVESLELGEDDMIALDEDGDPDAATQLKADDDFLLTPIDDDSDGEDSGSQVIALDSEEYDDAANTMLAGGMAEPSLLEEEPDMLAAAPGAGMGMGAPGLGGAATAAAGGPLMAPSAPPEAPYSIWNVMMLVFVAALLAVCGIMMVDLMRQMWSWDKPYALSSSVMDQVLQMIGEN